MSINHIRRMKAITSIILLTMAMLPFQNCGVGYQLSQESADTVKTGDDSDTSGPKSPTDKTAPSVAILSPQANSWVRSSVAVTGSCESGLEVLLTVNGVVVPNVMCNGQMFSANLSLNQPEGNLVLRASQTDRSKNTGSHQVTVVKDTIAPTVGISSPAQNAQLTTQALTVSGSCESGLRVRLTGTLLSAPVEASCLSQNFQAVISTVSTTGSFVLTATQTDEAGNAGSISRNIAVNIPAGAPTIAITSPAANSSTRANGITVAGTCTGTLTVQISGMGVNQASQTACNSGSFSAAITFSSGDGVKNIIVSQTNAQNVTGQNSRSFNVDRMAPIISILSPAANTQADTSLTISGSCDSDEGVVTIAGTGAQTSATTPCNSDSFMSSVTFSSGVGAKIVTVSQTDAVGNVGSSSRTFERIAPVLDGAVLYANNCASCHGVLANSTKINKTASAISGAISSVPQMGSIVLSAAQVDAVAAALYVAPNVNPFVCSPTQAPEGLDAKRLTKLQTMNAIRDLLSRALGTADANTILTSAQVSTRIPVDAASPYTSGDSNFSALHAQALFDTADLIAKSVVSSANYSRFVTTYINYDRGACSFTDASNLNTACREALIKNFLFRAWGRPIEADAANGNNELAAFLAAFQSEATTTAGVESLVYRALLSPEFLFHLQIDVQPSGGNYRLSSHLIARRLAFTLTQTLPDETLLDMARRNDLINDTAFANAVDYVAQRMSPSVETFTREWLTLDRLPAYRDQAHPKFSLITQGLTVDNALRTAMADEIVELMQFVSNNNRPFNDLFTSNISFARNSSLMRIYGQTTAAPTSVTEANAVRFSSSERSGLLTRAGMLFSGSHTENPVIRGVHVRKQIFCLTTASPPVELGDQITTPVPDVNMTTRERYHAKTSGSSCINCHSQINPVGFAFSKYNAFGAIQTQEPIYDGGNPPSLVRYIATDSRVNLSVGLGINRDVADGVELSTLVAGSSQFKRCMTQNIQAFVQGLASLPTTTNSCSMNRIYQTLDGPNAVKDVFRSAVSDNRFRYRTITK